MSEMDQRSPSPELARALAAVDLAQKALDEARALLRATPIEHGDAAPPIAGREWMPDWGKFEEARALLRCSRNTALRKIALHGLGHTVDRRWQVDLNRVRALQAKRPFPPLPGRIG